MHHPIDLKWSHVQISALICTILLILNVIFSSSCCDCPSEARICIQSVIFLTSYSSIPLMTNQKPKVNIFRAPVRSCSIIKKLIPKIPFFVSVSLFLFLLSVSLSLYLMSAYFKHSAYPVCHWANGGSCTVVAPPLCNSSSRQKDNWISWNSSFFMQTLTFSLSNDGLYAQLIVMPPLKQNVRLDVCTPSPGFVMTTSMVVFVSWFKAFFGIFF